MSRTMRLAAGIGLSLGLALPATALATEVTRSQTETGPAIQIVDVAGIRDQLQATPTNNGATIRIQEMDIFSPNPLVAGFGCTQIATLIVDCPTAPQMIAGL